MGEYSPTRVGFGLLGESNRQAVEWFLLFVYLQGSIGVQGLLSTFESHFISATQLPGCYPKFHTLIKNATCAMTYIRAFPICTIEVKYVQQNIPATLTSTHASLIISYRH